VVRRAHHALSSVEGRPGAPTGRSALTPFMVNALELGD
jgi:hypothetical protein